MANIIRQYNYLPNFINDTKGETIIHCFTLQINISCSIYAIFDKQKTNVYFSQMDKHLKNLNKQLYL